MWQGFVLPIQFGTLIGVTIDGLAQGFFLAMLGVGITLVFGLGEVLNLAIGTFAVVAALGSSTLANTVGLHPAVAGVVAVLGVGLLGLLVDRTILSLVYRSDGEERILLGIFTTLGLAICLDGALFNFYPGSYSLQVQFSPIRLGPVTVVPSSLVLIGVSLLVLVVVYLFLSKTFIGRATRTVFQDEVGALLVGIDPRRMRSLVFVLSSAVAGIAGVLFVVGSPVGVDRGFQWTTFALIVSIVGGVRNLQGAVVAGLFLGLIIQYANFFIGSFVANVILFTTAVAALLFRPEALS
jgi:branched-chain amino acid transport system permease protein